MQLPVRGHPLHTRSLTLVVTMRDDGLWHARGDVIDLRKVGFVPMVGDIQPAGIIHQMRIDLRLDPARARIETVEVDQPFVAIEPSPLSGGECCRDPAPRLQALAGERLGGDFVRRLRGVFGGALGCSHLLTLFEVMASGLERAIDLEAGGPGSRGRLAGDRLFRRAIFVEGFEAEDEAVELGVQLADFHTRPVPPEAPPTRRLAGQWDVRLFARSEGPERRLAGLRLAERERDDRSLAQARWRDRSDRLAPLEGAPIFGGLARQLLAIFDGPDDRRLLDAGLQLAPGYIQVMAAVMDRWLARPGQAGVAGAEPAAGPVGGMADSCYMWRRDGPMLRLRSSRESGSGWR